jgi:hypothetical protein
METVHPSIAISGEPDYVADTLAMGGAFLLVARARAGRNAQDAMVVSRNSDARRWRKVRFYSLGADERDSVRTSSQDLGRFASAGAVVFRMDEIDTTQRSGQSCLVLR